MSRRSDIFVAGTALGLAIGFVTGLLLAPVNGATTRKRIVNEAYCAIGAVRSLATQAEGLVWGMGRRVEHFLGKDEEIAWEKVRELREGVTRFKIDG